ncbi:MAG TPA: GNAT family N-acetyltransferase [Segetibacter sp.]|jgi:ribosomal protein S18 acetylase RimI-like enzyme
MLSIKRIEKEGKDLENALSLFKEYFIELNENLCFQNFDDELKDPLKKYGAPHGSIFIAYQEQEPAGCIALQDLGKLVCEMKRLYVKPYFRGSKVGEELVKILLKDATEKGYKKMVLDTLQRLQPAIKLYQRYGFHNTSAYYVNPLPGVMYMEKQLV